MNRNSLKSDFDPTPTFGWRWWTGVVLILAYAFLPLSFAQAAPDPVSPPPGLVAWWPGDGFALDVVSTNAGTLLNGATYSTGEVGQAFNLNGTSSYIQAPHSAVWSFGSNDFTIELWANFGSATGSTALVASDAGAGATNKWIFWLNGGKLQFHINGTNNIANIGSGAFSPNLNQWYHLGVTRQFTNYTFYINGVAVATNIDARAIPDSGVPLTIGQAENNFFFNGSLDEISIYNRALSGSEISAVYAAGISGKAYAVTPAPSFVQQPTNQTVYLLGIPVFSAAAMGVPRPSYQWQFNGNNLTDATNASLTLTNVSLANAGSYGVLVSNSVAVITNLSVLTVRPLFRPGSSNNISAGGKAMEFKRVSVVLPGHEKAPCLEIGRVLLRADGSWHLQNGVVFRNGELSVEAPSGYLQVDGALAGDVNLLMPTGSHLVGNIFAHASPMVKSHEGIKK